MGVCSSAKNNEGGEKNDDKDKGIIKGRNPKDENDENKTQKKPPAYPQIEVKFLEKGEEKLTMKFQAEAEIEALFDELKNLYPNSEYDLLTTENISLISHLEEKLYEMFENKNQIEVNMFYLGLELPSDIRKEYEENTIFATPLLDFDDQLGLVIYNKFDQQITHILINNKALSVFNYLSGYCNGKNTFYISGGEEKGAENSFINTFYSIDLMNKEIIEKLPNLSSERGWHSMLFVPPKYVFIVGGTSKTVELYDTEKKIVSVEGELNEQRNECTLCVINNSWLYAFCGFEMNESHLNSIEKCNLRKGKREWVFVNYTTSDDILFEQCYYISFFFSDSSIILFGSSENTNNDFHSILFDYENEDNPVIQRYETNVKIKDICPEKFFHPLSDKNFILFPLTTTILKMYVINEDMKLTIQEYPNVMNEIME